MVEETSHEERASAKTQTLCSPGSWLNWTNSKQEITMQHNNRNDERQKPGSGRQGEGTCTVSGCVAPGFQELERAQL